MKAILLATALIAAPVIAQDQPPAPPADSGQGAPGQPAPNPDPATDAANDAAAAAATAQTPPPPPGPTSGQVVFKQPPTVEQAFPPPPPKESYPWCSKTVTDGCKQRIDPK